MEARREQALVGLFVLVAAALLLVTVFALGGVFGRATTTYRANFRFAGGLEPGGEVRFAGGPRVGRVDRVRIDAQSTTPMEITFSVPPDLPVKTDSTVRILSLSPLGENHLEIYPGSTQAPRAPAGSVLPSEPYVDFNALTAQLNSLAPEARQLLEELHQRTNDLQVTIARVNDLLNDRNRTNLSASLSSVRGTLEENRPKLDATMGHLEAASAKMAPLLDDLKRTSQQANQALDHMDALIGENRPDLRRAVAELRRTLESTRLLAAQFDRTLDVNAEILDEILDNLRHTTENLKEFTDTIKTRPYTLIRSTTPAEHKPGAVKQP